MIRVEDEGPVRVVTLDRPEKRNALTISMLGDLRRAFEASGEKRAMVLLGAGPVFCAGFDLHERVSRDANRLAALRLQLTELASVIEAMRAGEAPIVVGVQGAAVAGGCALLGGGDIIVSDRSARLGYPVLRLGISPAVTGPWLRAAVGDGAARSLMLDPALIDAERAAGMGLVHELAEGDVAERALAAARSLASKPGRAVPATRRWLAEIERATARVEASEALGASLSATDGETERRLAEQVWKT